jgi:ABC transporter, permease protein
MIKNGKMTLLIHIVLTLFTILAVLPFILMFMSSITDESMIFQNGYSFIPDKLSADAYRYVLVNLGQIGRAYGVTVFITVSGTVVNLLITAMLAYSLSRPFLPCRRFFNLLVVLTLLFNGGLVPTYLVYTQIFHIKNTVWALLLPNLLMSPFHVILAKTYFINSIPSEIMDAATIDGAGEIRIFFRLVLPLAKPMIVTIGLFSGIAYWND